MLTIYVVKQGDSIYSIAKKYGVPMQKIIDANRLKSTQRLMPGQALVVLTDNIRHTVTAGQSLYSLAKYYDTTVAVIQEANPQISDPNKIAVGQVLIIPVAQQKQGPIIVNGFTLPGISDDTLADTLPHLTYISIFSYQVKADGSLTPVTDRSIIQTARNNSVAPLMVITNTKEGEGFDSDLAHAILTNPQVQDTLLQNVINTLKSKNYIGLNIDFEYIYREDRQNYNNFIKKVTNRLHPLDYKVSTALAPKLSGSQKGLLYEAHDYAAHGATVDYVILMTYEWGYTFGPAMAVAPLDQMEKVLQYAISVMPSKKILMGMPNYGYDWTLPFVEGSAAQSLSNTAAVDLAARVGAHILFDPKSMTPNFKYYDADGKQHEVWFDDARSIKAKLGLVQKYDLAGVSYWTINSFFPQNWLVLDSMYQVQKVL